MDEQGTEVYITAFTDPKQPGLAARGMLSRHQANPRGNLPPILKVSDIADRGHHGRGRHGHPGDCLEALAHWMRGTDGLQLRGIVRQPLLQGAKFLVELPEEFLA